MSTAEREKLETESTSTSEYTCTNCGSVTPKGMMSWCPDCGFYPEIEKFRVEESEPEEVVVEEDVKFRWTWNHTMCLGLLCVFLVTFAGRMFYNYCDSDPAYWTLIQAVWGVIFLVSTHISAGLFALKKSPKHGPVSWFVNPIETWGPLFEANAFQQRLCCLTWGVAATVLPFFLIGGVTSDHFFAKIEHRKPSFNLLQSVVGMAKGAQSDADSSGSLDDAIQDFVGDVHEQLQNDSRENRHVCSIYGYMTGGGDRVRRLLLATRVQGELKHFTAIGADQLSDARVDALSQVLPTIRQTGSSVRTSHSGKWVSPTQMVVMVTDGIDSFGNHINLRVQESPAQQSKDGEE